MALLAGYLIGKPFYIFPSGNPQVADLAIVLFFAAALILPRTRWQRQSADVVRAAAVFAGYLAIVNLTWAAIRVDLGMAKIASIYVFNFIVLHMIHDLKERHGDLLIRFTAYSIFASVVVQCFLSLFITDLSSGRQIMYFNNPNQVGYYALLCACIFFICTTKIQVRFHSQVLFALMVVYLSALSLSKAAMLSMALLFLVHFTKKPKLTGVAVIAVATLILLGVGTDLLDNVLGRVENIGQQVDDSIAGRGYDRIWKFPEYIALGAGELGFDRFRYDRFRQVTVELHSTIGTILFSYGVVGVFLFVFFMWRIYRTVGFHLLLYLVPPLVYGLTHQGLRFSLLWILFAVVSCLPTEASAKK